MYSRYGLYCAATKNCKTTFSWLLHDFVDVSKLGPSHTNLILVISTYKINTPVE